MARSVFILVCLTGGGWFAVAATELSAQQAARIEATSKSEEASASKSWTRWAGAGALLFGAALLDSDIRQWVGERRSAFLDDVAKAGQDMGRTANIRPALAAALLGGYLTRRKPWIEGTLHVAAAYAGVDAVVSLLKPVVGRHRPAGGAADDFKAFAWHGGEWHSFPSAHAAHAFSLAAAIAEEAGTTWVSVLAYGTAAVVAWSRVYHEAHWTSDVVAAAILGTFSGRAAVRFLHSAADTRNNTIRMSVSPGSSGVWVILTVQP